MIPADINISLLEQSLFNTLFNLNGDSSYSEIVYSSDILEESSHTVKIVANGNINLDSIIVW